MKAFVTCTSLCSALAMAVALGAVSETAWANEQVGGGASADAVDGPAGSTGIADIIVTASRRAVSMQRESRAMAAIGGEELARSGTIDPAQLPNLVPGLTIARNGANLQVSVRGVGDRTINASTDPAVAMNVDSVYYPKSYEVRPVFYDLERVEVLKGPQGTLYGRNASAGAINLIPARPTFELGGFVEGEYGNYDQKRLTGAINVPLNDVVAVRLSGQIVRRDGFLPGGYNDDKSEGGRLQVLIEPDATTSLRLSGSYSHIGGKGDAAVIMRRRGSTPSSSPVADPSDPWNGPGDPETYDRVVATDPSSASILSNDGYLDVNVYTLSADFEHDMGWAKVTVLPSYVGSDFKSRSYPALVVGSYGDTVSNQYSLETRVSSPDASATKWVVGLFGALEDVKDSNQALIPYPGGTFVLVGESPRRDDRTLAAFGEATVPLATGLRGIAGARYTWEKKVITGYTNAIFAPVSGFPVSQSDPLFPQASSPGSVSIAGSRTDKAFNYRLGLEYDVAPQSMLFATVSSGFKAGGFYANVAPENSYKPEKLTAFEIGAKNRFFGNRLQLNLEGYYWKYTDKQESFLAVLPIGNVLVTQNAGKVTIYGADVSLTGQVTNNDTLSAEVEYLHSNYDSYVYSYTGTPDSTINCGTAVSGSTTTRDCSGFPLVRAPKWSGNVSYRHTQSLGSAGSLLFTAQMNFSSSYFISNNFTALTYTKPYQTFDASLSWTAPNKPLTLTGYIQNIGNTPVYTGGLQSASLTDAAVAQIGAPRTYGVRLRFKY